MRGRQQRLLQGLGLGTINHAELGQLGTGVLDQSGGERLSGLERIGFERPILRGLETFDLLFPLDDQPQSRRLHPPGRQTGPDFFPQ